MSIVTMSRVTAVHLLSVEPREGSKWHRASRILSYKRKTPPPHTHTQLLPFPIPHSLESSELRPVEPIVYPVV